MKYSREQFNAEVMCAIENSLPKEYEDAKVSVQKVVKTNDQDCDYISILRPGEEIAPRVNLTEKFYEYSVMDRDFLDCVEEIRGICLCDVSGEFQDFASKISEYQRAKDYLQIELCELERNQKRLENLVHTQHGIFAAAYFVRDDEIGAQVAITKKLLDHWNISIEQLHQDALAAEMGTAILFTVDTSIGGIIADPDFEPQNLLGTSRRDLETDEVLFCLTNRYQYHGASLLLQDSLLQQIGEFMGENYFVIPSSIHEVMLLPESLNSGVSELMELIRWINKASVQPHDVLSDELLYYDRSISEVYSLKETV